MRTLIATLLVASACSGDDATIEPDAIDSDADIRPSEWKVDASADSIPCPDAGPPAELHILPRLLNTATPVVPEFMLECDELELVTDRWLLVCGPMTFNAPIGGGPGRVVYGVQSDRGTCVVGYTATFEEA